MTNNEDRMPYSYHTFMYPFYWNSGSLPIDQNDNWKRNELKKTMDTASDEELLTYASWQYFSPKARRLIFDWEDSAVECYRFAGVNTENSFLDLWLDGDKEDPMYHRLRVNQIRLELLNDFKIGVLILETENYGEVTDAGWQSCRDIFCRFSQEQRLNEITKINDLGRRVFSPFLIKKNGIIQKGTEAPWEMTLEIKGTLYFLVDCTHIDEEIEQTPRGFEELILDSSENQIELHPAIDDRMFVSCCLGVRHFNAFCPGPGGKYGYQSSRNSAEMLYKLLFLERGDPTCQNREMIQQKLREHLDPRWIQYGTMHGVTEYSMLCITGCDESGHLDSERKGDTINPFLTEYVEMAKIALLQRAAIIQLEDEASRISREIPDLDTATDKTIEKNIEDIRSRWKKYLLFQSELLLSEVTFQEQGVEMYDILKRSFRISELSTSLNTNMYNLHEMAEFEDAALRRRHDDDEKNRNKNLEKAVNLFAVMGVSISLAAMTQDAAGYAKVTETGQTVQFILIELLSLAAEFVCLYLLNIVLLKSIEKSKYYYFWIWFGTILIVVLMLLIQVNVIPYCLR